MGELDVQAVTDHEIFTAYIRAGFTRTEALELIKGINATRMLWAFHQQQARGDG